jgi:hypothetical protein
MKEEAQGFPTAWGSIGFSLHPKALEVSENEFVFGKSKLTMGVARGKQGSRQGRMQEGTWQGHVRGGGGVWQNYTKC